MRRARGAARVHLVALTIILAIVAWRASAAAVFLVGEWHWFAPERALPAIVLDESERVAAALASNELTQIERTLTLSRDPAWNLPLDDTLRAKLEARRERLAAAIARNALQPLELAGGASPASVHVAAHLLCERTLPRATQVVVRMDVPAIDSALVLALEALHYPRTFASIDVPPPGWTPSAMATASELYVLELGDAAHPLWQQLLGEHFELVAQNGPVRLHRLVPVEAGR